MMTAPAAPASVRARAIAPARRIFLMPGRSRW
jgi:hypothetical protein